MEKNKDEVIENRGKQLLSRRAFLKLTAGTGTGLLLAGFQPALAAFLEPNTDSPLEFYPARNWEQVYRNIYSTDSDFHFLCAPNDTHNCLLNSTVQSLTPSCG